MPIVETAASILTRNEIACLIGNLTVEQGVRLRMIARQRAFGRPIESEDLLQEAFRRALDGNRNCPKDLDIVAFLAQTMRSIAHGEYKKMQQGPHIASIARHGESTPPVSEPPDPTPSIEDQLSEKQNASRLKMEILALFDDDEIAKVIVEGLMEELEGEELRKLTDLDMKGFQTKRRLIRRRLAKHYPKGRNHDE